MDLSELFAGRDLDLPGMQQRVLAVAAEVGLPLTAPSRIFNSRRAQELGKFAQKMGRMEAYLESVYRACFVEGRNIALMEELLQIAQRAGLPETEARLVLEEGVFGKEVDDDWQRARLLGIRAVPAFLCGGKLLVGFRPYQDLAGLIAPD